ncbi:tRNA pseudouridine(38-40) synthase TruA [Vulcanisaeta souniana]|nr:tRNA pseudouridine(38-40) synthase TruA [Vulcanisaeta souniana]GGI81916.1 tRNA pseudouridine(38-40) synthase TruA [Vulcanisaeta souniana JCM 11219]
MVTIAFKVFYDGSLFNGFTGNTGSIEYYLRRAIRRFVKDFTLSKASRTDPGVSAVGNVVSIQFSDGHKLTPGMLNSRLPHGLRVWAWAEVNDEFNAKIAVSRTYIYVMPWLYEDVDLMKGAAELFVGVHDLSNFQVKERGVPTTVMINGVNIERYGDYLVLIITGRGFRNKMIRKIVNAIRMVGLGTLSIDELRDLIEFKVKRPVPPASPYGLLLLNVNYGNREPNWLLCPGCLSYVVNYLGNRWYNSLPNLFVILKILHEFMDINKLFSRI